MPCGKLDKQEIGEYKVENKEQLSSEADKLVLPDTGYGRKITTARRFSKRKLPVTHKGGKYPVRGENVRMLGEKRQRDR